MDQPSSLLQYLHITNDEQPTKPSNLRKAAMVISIPREKKKLDIVFKNAHPFYINPENISRRALEEEFYLEIQSWAHFYYRISPSGKGGLRAEAVLGKACTSARTSVLRCDYAKMM